MSYETQSLQVFFVLFVFEKPLKDFPFYSPILLTFKFRYLQTRIKKSCMYLSSQIFFKTQKEKKKSAAAADPQHLKVEVADQDFPNCSHVINRTCQYLTLIM